MYREEKTAEEIYSEYYDTDDLKRNYDVEQKAVANNIPITKLDDLLDKIFENPNDFYQKICENLTTEERIFILKNLENKSCSTCLNGSCRVESNEKVGLNELGKPQGSNCIGWYNDEIIGKSKVLKISDIHKLK